MTEPTYNPKAPQSEQKLRIYSYYLEVYSHILLRLSHVRGIHVYDLMAGKGDKDGSAMRAFEICEAIRQKFGNKIRLHLNEKNPEYYRTLCKSINPTANNWVTCENMDVNDAVKQHCSPEHNIYKLFFLDPFGYTQVDKESIDLIVSKYRSECLLFVPEAFIFRYTKDAPLSEQEPAIKKFFRQFNIDANQYKNAHVSKRISIIRDALKNPDSKQYIGACHLDAGRDVYALYFMGRHIYGLHKFLESARLAEKKNLQLALFPLNDDEIFSYLSEERTNKELYEWVLRQNWSLLEVRKVLKEMECQRQIFVRKTPHAPHRRIGDFYLDHPYFNKPARITVKSSYHGD